MLKPKLKWIGIALLAILCTSALIVSAQDDVSPRMVEIVEHTDPFVDWLTNYPGYTSNAWLEEGGIWHVEFYSADQQEWLGYARVNPDNGEVIESFAPIPLPPDVYTRQQARLNDLVFQDPEITTLIGDPILWNYSIDWNRWEQRWQAHFYRGIDAWLVNLNYNEDEETFYIDAITDEHAIDEDTQRQANRDHAIQLAYLANGVDQALNGFDTWTTYAENLHNTVWSVSFVNGDTELFYAIVDLSTDTVLESDGS